MIELPIVEQQASANETPEAQPKQRLWRSIADLRKDKDFQDVTQHEFMPGAAETPKGASRRQFLQLMGASMAMAGLTACRRPVEKILPYTRKPEEIIPGIPLFYATAMPFRGVVRPLLVESHEGRPTKVEGNPEHPSSRGATGVFEQASVLNLYDPDRSDTVLFNGSAASWADFVSFSQSMAASAAGRRMVVLSEETSSPTVQALRQQLTQRFPQLRWITYRAEGDDPVQLGLQQAFGRPLRPAYQFSQAQVIVSLDADFLGPTARNFVHATREFADGRRLDGPDDTMSRLYVVESNHSLTGGMADNRLRLRSSEIPALAAALASRLGVGGSASGPFANHPFVAAMAADLQAAGANGVVLAGETQPPAVHALCAAINSALGSVGTTMLLYDTGLAPVRSQDEEMTELVRDMVAGNVDTLLCLGVNPVYDAPAGVDFAAAMNSVGETIHVGLWVDETAQAASWHIPRAHYLEAWGDGRSYDGTLSVIQPLIAPLYDDAKSEIEVLNVLATGLDQSGYDLVRDQWRTVVTGTFENGWRKALHDGYLPNTAYTPTTAGASAPATTAGPSPAPAGATASATPADTTATAPATGAPMPSQAIGEDELELVFRLDPTVLDGTYANNAWCQELPDPTTKLVWDNVALMSPATAERLDLEVEYHKGKYIVDRVTLTVGGASIELPVWVMPGHANNSISVTMGYGRNIQSDRLLPEDHFFDTDYETNIYAQGPLANGVGANVAKVRPAMSTMIVTGVEVSKTGETHTIVTTQEHGAINIESRPLFRVATYDEYKQNPAFVEEFEAPSPGEPFEEYPPLWESRHPEGSAAMKDNPYYRNQWGMVVDLNACTGCNACIVACSIENNVQVVGKEYVGQGREMQWLRLDRYFLSEDIEEAPENPQMVVQPVLCMHCENAPCESVCPVAATVHSPDGTNQMIYNRCIGTRYCSNNCPYKVRRYNFFNWSKTIPVQVQMMQNPNVTVRFRGVMEKCSFCVQRIRRTQQRAQLEDRNVQDGEVMTACQQACPAQALTFGDLNNPESAVSKQKENSRRYEMLAELDVKPRVSYLGRVRNPNPNLVQENAIPNEPEA